MNTRIKLCTFDVTNTLLKFRSPVGLQYAQVGRIYGVDRDSDLLSDAFRHQWKILNLTHPNYGCNSGLTSRDWWKLLAKNVFNHDTSKLTEKQLDSISLHLYDLYKGNSCWEVAPYAVSLLKALKQKRVNIGVISNFDERLDSVLISNGLKSYFDFILASYLVKVAKPDKKIFDNALSNCNGVSSSEALHVGDNIELDYKAAKNAGWKALLLSSESTNNEVPENVDPSDVIPNLEGIKNIVLYP